MGEPCWHEFGSYQSGYPVCLNCGEKMSTFYNPDYCSDKSPRELLIGVAKRLEQFNIKLPEQLWFTSALVICNEIIDLWVNNTPPCLVEMYSSRVCERGTISCITQHTCIEPPIMVES